MANPQNEMFNGFVRTSNGDLKNTEFNPFDIKRRKRTTPEQLRILEAVFQTNRTPNSALRKNLSVQLHMSQRAVQVWFQNKRAKCRQLERAKSSQKNPEGQKQPFYKGFDGYSGVYGGDFGQLDYDQQFKKRFDPPYDEGYQYGGEVGNFVAYTDSYGVGGMSSTVQNNTRSAEQPSFQNFDYPLYDPRYQQGNFLDVDQGETGNDFLDPL